MTTTPRRPVVEVDPAIFEAVTAVPAWFATGIGNPGLADAMREVMADTATEVAAFALLRSVEVTR